MHLRLAIASPIGMAATVAAVAVVSVSMWVEIIDRVDRTFPGFLLLGNGVVASAGLTNWPASAEGAVFQSRLLSYEGVEYSGTDEFHADIAQLSPGTPVSYEFQRGIETFEKTIATRTFTGTDAALLYGATFLSALALLGVALALRYLAPADPASGCALSLAIAGIWALTALDLYGPYRFFRIHAFSECLLAAGSVHMALVFPYQREIILRYRWIIPGLYGASVSIGLVQGVFLYSAPVYSAIHRLAVALAAVSFAVLVGSQILAFTRPKSLEARQRVKVLALGTAASMTPGLIVLLAGAISDNGAIENAVGWAGGLFPISIAYAVLRADLLEVDSILRRSVSYALVTLIVGLSYAAAVGGFESLASGQADVPRWVSVLVFSCFCTFALLPIRDRIQSLVDRIFFRTAYDFRVMAHDTSEKLARLVDIDLIRREIESAINSALQPESCHLTTLAERGVHEFAEDAPTELISDSPDGGVTVNFRSHNRIVAKLELGRRLSGRFYTGQDRDLLTVLSNQGAIAIENALAVEEVRELNRTLEGRVQERTAELAEALEELTKTQSDLVNAERMAAVGEIAAGVAHEVNNPLNFARNSLRALETVVSDLADRSLENNIKSEQSHAASKPARKSDSPSPAELATDARDLVEILGSGLDRTARLVAELRDFATPQHRESLEFEIVPVVEEALRLAGATLDERGISTEINCTDESLRVVGSQEALGQVLLNLIKNSIDALEGRKAPSIAIFIGEETDRRGIRLTVADNGEGISPDLVEQVFDPFFTTKDAGKGTGLGLAICNRIVGEHSGEIWVDSIPGSGTEMHVFLPNVSRNAYES